MRSPYVVYLEQANQLSVSVALETGLARLVNGASRTTTDVGGGTLASDVTGGGGTAMMGSAASSQRAMRAQSLLLFAIVALLAAFAPSLLCASSSLWCNTGASSFGRVAQLSSLLCIIIAIVTVSDTSVFAQLPDATLSDRCEPAVDLTIAVPPSVRRLCDDNSCLCNVGWTGADCSTSMVMLTEMTTSNVTLPPINVVTCIAGELGCACLADQYCKTSHGSCLKGYCVCIDSGMFERK